MEEEQKTDEEEDEKDIEKKSKRRGRRRKRKRRKRSVDKKATSFYRLVSSMCYPEAKTFEEDQPQRRTDNENNVRV